MFFVVIFRSWWITVRGLVVVGYRGGRFGNYGTILSSLSYKKFEML